MLLNKHVSAAVRLVDALSSNGYQVSARPDSYLSGLTNECVSILPLSNGNDSNEASPHEQLLAQSARKGPLGDCLHDIAMEELTGELSRAVNSGINFARNTVNPIIRDIYQRVEEGLASRAHEVALRFNVMPLYYNPIWSAPVLRAVLKKYEKFAMPGIKISVGYPTLPLDALLAAVRTGVDTIDTAIAEICTSSSERVLEDLYAAVFLNSAECQGKYNLRQGAGKDGWFFSPSRNNANYVLVIHYLAKGLLENPPEEFKGSAKQYANELSMVVGAAGVRMLGVVEQRERDLKQQLLVLDYPTGGGKFATCEEESYITVNGDVYDRYLEDGGVPEVLIGEAQSTRNRAVPEITSNAANSLRIYQTNERMLAETTDAKLVTRKLQLVRFELERFLSGIPDEDLRVSRESIYKRINVMVTAMDRADLDNLWVSLRRMICHLFFAHTDSLRILTRMDEVAARMATVDAAGNTVQADIRVVALHATVDILVEWIAENLELTKVTQPGM